MEPGVQAVKVPSAGGGPSVRAVLAVLLVAVGLAFVKPWGSGDDSGGGGPGPPVGPAWRPGAARTAPASQAPSASAGRAAAPTAEELVASFCLEPSGWRVVSTEEFSGRQIRSWTAANPIDSANGPYDPRIPITPIVSHSVLTVGYCTPIAGSNRPPGDTVTTIYWREAPGSATDPVNVHRLLPRLATSPLGAVYAAPRTSYPTLATGWQTGTWIFKVTGDQAFERWFGVAVEIIPPLVRSSPSPPPTASP